MSTQSVTAVMAVVVATAAARAPQLHAQGYPNKPVRVVKEAGIRAD